jgi:hypothetical protein
MSSTYRPRWYPFLIAASLMFAAACSDKEQQQKDACYNATSPSAGLKACDELSNKYFHEIMRLRTKQDYTIYTHNEENYRSSVTTYVKASFKEAFYYEETGDKADAIKIYQGLAGSGNMISFVPKADIDQALDNLRRLGAKRCDFC